MELEAMTQTILTFITKLFTVQGSPLRRRVENLSRFVVVKGGAYFFLPSLRGLNYIARLQPQR
jgi:hypothetical protein